MLVAGSESVGVVARVLCGHAGSLRMEHGSWSCCWTCTRVPPRSSVTKCRWDSKSGIVTPVQWCVVQWDRWKAVMHKSIPRSSTAKCRYSSVLFSETGEKQSCARASLGAAQRSAGTAVCCSVRQVKSSNMYKSTPLISACQASSPAFFPNPLPTFHWNGSCISLLHLLSGCTLPTLLAHWPHLTKWTTLFQCLVRCQHLNCYCL